MGILDVKNMVCERCSRKGNWDDLFCSKCGGTLKKFKPLPYIGEAPQKGIYRITIVVEREFNNLDVARECAEKSELGEDEGYFRDYAPDSRLDGCVPIKVEFVHSTVTPETHPYECRHCPDPPAVSKTAVGRCEWCDQQDWVLRKGFKGHPNGVGGSCHLVLVDGQCETCGYQLGDE